MGDSDAVEIDVRPTVFGPGVWFAMTSMAARARTPQQIDNFIGTAIPVMTNLLCSTCSRHARKNIKILHPNAYRNRKDHRGENIGMFLWIYDLHNIVNEIADPKKEQMPLDHALAIYEPILRLTTEEINKDYKYSQSPNTIENIHFLSFVEEDETDVSLLEPEEDIPEPVKVDNTNHVSNIPRFSVPRTGIPNIGSKARHTPCRSCGKKD
jgi:hypothetical protein